MSQITETCFTTFLKSILFILCSICPKCWSQYDHQNHPTGTFLRGPTNQTVQLGQSCRFQCSIQNQIGYDVRKKEWKKTIHDIQMHVQWIIDGFGVTNETLRSVFDERYIMDGSISEGIYDLVISKVRLEDEASFICQANVKMYRISQSPIVETLTSQPAYLTVVVPPKAIILKKPEMAYHNQSKSNGDFVEHLSSGQVTISWDNYTHGKLLNKETYRPAVNIVADDPTSLEVNRNTLTIYDNSINLRKIAGSNHTVRPENHRESGRPLQGIKSTVPVVWVKENGQLTLECRTSRSKPAAQIAWVLAGVHLSPDNRSRTYENHNSNWTTSTLLWRNRLQNIHMFENPKTERITSKEQYEIDSAHFYASDETNSMEYINSEDNKNGTNDIMQVTVSTLRLIIQRHHQQQLLQCSINNAKEFLTEELPKVSAIIEPMYVDKIRIETANKNEVREGISVEYRCSAFTNPPTPIFRWQLIRPDSREVEVGEYLNDSHNVLLYQMETNVSASSDPSQLHLRLYRDMHRGRIVCWVGVRTPSTQYDVVPEAHKFEAITRPGETNEFMTWQKTEQELNVLYGPVFDQMIDNLRATKIGLLTTIDCMADSNPSAQISLYRLGAEGQKLLERLSSFYIEMNDSRTRNDRLAKPVPYLTEQRIPLRNEIGPSELAKAIKSKGTQILASATQNINYPLQINRIEDFGFYICVARNSGFPPAFRHVLVGETGPPKIIECREIRDYNGHSIELVCLIHSIPRPKVEEISWIRKGIPVRSDERFHIYHEHLIRGVRSALQFRKFSTEDISEYNCTVVNEYGTDWKIVSISNESSLPLVFVIGSGAAAILAVIFVTVIGCFIRHSRKRSVQSSEQSNHFLAKKTHTNGFEPSHTIEHYQRTYDTPMQTITQSRCVPVTNSDAENQQMCHFCLTAKNPAFLDTQLEMDDILGGGTSVNCKKSDDSGYEPGDVTSVTANPNDHICLDHTASISQNFSPLLGTMLLRNSPVVCYTTTPQNSSTSSTPQFGNTFVNLHANSYMAPASTVTRTRQQPQPHTFSQYGSSYNTLTRSKPVISRTLSPILFVTPSVSHNRGYETTVHPTEMILPQVIFQPNGLIASPMKNVCSTPSTELQSCEQPVIHSPTLLTTAPYIYPDLSVSPLNFADHESKVTPIPTASYMCSVMTSNNKQPSGVSWQNVPLNNSKSSDDDSTNV